MNYLPGDLALKPSGRFGRSNLLNKLRQVLDISQEGIVVLEPQFEEADDASNHGEFTFMCMREIDFYMIFAKIGVDPHKDFTLVVEEDHVFIDDEVPIPVGQPAAGTYNRLRVPQSALARTQFLYFGYRLVME